MALGNMARALAEYDAANQTPFARIYLSAPKMGLFGSYKALDPQKVAAAPAAYLVLIAAFRRTGGYRPVTLG